MVPANLKYTVEHEWLKIDGNIGTVGITDHAQSALGDITFVELPEKGDTVNQGETMAAVESVKAASDVYAPISGEIIDINENLNDQPEIINDSPYDRGWICKIIISDPSELTELMDAKGYEDFLKEINK